MSMDKIIIVGKYLKHVLIDPFRICSYLLILRKLAGKVYTFFALYYITDYDFQILRYEQKQCSVSD